MFVRWLLTHLQVYRALDKLGLWGVYLSLLTFARRGFVHGYLAMLTVMFAALGLLGAWEYSLRALRRAGLPDWGHLILAAPMILFVAGLILLGIELWIWGIRGPDQPVIRNLFWSAAHEDRYQAHLAWVKNHLDRRRA